MIPKASPPSGRRERSLLERAADIYGFTQNFRAADTRKVPVEQTPRWTAEDIARVAYEEPEFPMMEVEAHHALPVSHALPVDLPEEYRAAATPGMAVSIDRALLAERGMIVPGAPVGPLAEEFRLVKRQLLVTAGRIAEGAAPDKARTMLVCSARPRDGKTFCAVNLALSIAAERDTEVLLVDGDFAKPDVMARLGLDDGPGFLDALADSSIDPENLVLPTDVAHLSVLPAGERSTSDHEMLASNRTHDVIARLLAANPRRMIIFDSPPALAASPASVLARLVGQVMLVVRADSTPESELREAVGQLDGCDHIQLLLNAVSFVPGGHRFGSYYGEGRA